MEPFSGSRSDAASGLSLVLFSCAGTLVLTRVEVPEEVPGPLGKSNGNLLCFSPPGGSFS